MEALERSVVTGRRLGRRGEWRSDLPDIGHLAAQGVKAPGAGRRWVSVWAVLERHPGVARWLVPVRGPVRVRQWHPQGTSPRRLARRQLQASTWVSRRRPCRRSPRNSPGPVRHVASLIRRDEWPKPRQRVPRASQHVLLSPWTSTRWRPRHPWQKPTPAARVLPRGGVVGGGGTWLLRSIVSRREW